MAKASWRIAELAAGGILVSLALLVFGCGRSEEDLNKVTAAPLPTLTLTTTTAASGRPNFDERPQESATTATTQVSSIVNAASTVAVLTTTAPSWTSTSTGSKKLLRTTTVAVVAPATTSTTTTTPSVVSATGTTTGTASRTTTTRSTTTTWTGSGAVLQTTHTTVPYTSKAPTTRSLRSTSAAARELTTTRTTTTASATVVTGITTNTTTTTPTPAAESTTTSPISAATSEVTRTTTTPATTSGTTITPTDTMMDTATTSLTPETTSKTLTTSTNTTTSTATTTVTPAWASTITTTSTNTTTGTATTTATAGTTSITSTVTTTRSAIAAITTDEPTTTATTIKSGAAPRSPVNTTLLAWPTPLASVRNCYLAPLQSGAGCEHLGTDRGPEFGLNEFGQETTAKRACLARLHILGGDSFVFAVGWCQVWRCGSRSVLRASAGSGAEPLLPEGAALIALRTFHSTYLDVESDGHVAATSTAVGASSSFLLVRNDDDTVSLASAQGDYVDIEADGSLRADHEEGSSSARFELVGNGDGTVSLRSPAGKFLSAQPDGGVVADRTAVDAWEQFSLVELTAEPTATANDEGASPPAAPTNASVYSSLCEYQESTGGRLGRERRSPVFVKLWEWNYVDVARECEEYLGPNGFDAVQISPVTEHILGYQWWTKYQPVSFGLSTRSGSAKDLRTMVAACRAAGVEVIVDVLLNHIASPCHEAMEFPEAATATPCGGWNGSRYGNRRMEGAHGWDAAKPEHFHHEPGQLFENCEVSAQTGWLCGSPDLRDCSCCGCDMYGMPDRNTSIPSVRETLARHLHELHDMGVTMLRLDAAIYTDVESLSNIVNRAPWDYVYQEWWGEYPVTDRTLYIGHYRDVDYRWKLTNVLANKAPEEFPDVLKIKSGVFGLNEETSLYPFAYHDGRTPSAHSGIATYKNGLEYHQQQRYFLAAPYGVSVLLWGGYGWSNMEQGPPGCEWGSTRCSPKHVFDERGQPQCMPTPMESPMSAEQARSRSWVCEHRWAGVAGLVNFRKACRGLPVTETWLPGEQPAVYTGNLAFRLGNSCFVAIVRGFNSKKPQWGPLGNWTLAGLVTGLPAGRYCDLASLPTQRGWDRRSCPREVELGEAGAVLRGKVPQGDLLTIHTGARLG